jgi:hypothetical protein
METAMYGIQFDDVSVRFGSFPFYYTKAEAERVAAIYRAHWPYHTYKVVRVRPDPWPGTKLTANGKGWSYI